MTDSHELISHPDRTLSSHLSGCDEGSRLQLEFKYISEEHFFSRKLIEEMRHLLVYFHDFGKGTDYFAAKIIEAIENELYADNPAGKSVKNTEVLDLATRLYDYITAFKSGKYKQVRTEMRLNPRLGDHSRQGAYMVLSAFDNPDRVLGFILLKIILKHHGDLTNFWVDKRGNHQIFLDPESPDMINLEKQLSRHDFELYQKILEKQGLKISPEDWIKVRELVTDEYLIDDLQYEFEELPGNLRYFVLQHFLYSLLLSADKGDVKLPGNKSKAEFIKPNRLLPVDLVSGFKSVMFPATSETELDRQREEAYVLVARNVLEYSGKNFFSVTLPTGMGKTFTALNAAIILQNEYASQTSGKTPRIIYCLPFTSIIDQNAAIFERILAYGNTVNPDIKEDWLVKNHYLSSYNETYDDLELVNQEPEYLADGWENEIIVTTFVQFLESIFTNRNSALRKFHNMTNSVVVLDEVQNIPAKYYRVIERVFKDMARFFNTKFVFVTATQPILFSNISDIFELTNGRTETYFRQLCRIQLDQSILQNNSYQPITREEFVEILLADIADNPDKSFLIICNTIALSRWLFEQIEQKFAERELIYLSSSLIPPVRRWKIRKIKKSSNRPIVVSTQVVEAGVDIDLDIVYRDFAPIDSINQSAGRCNRNAKKGTGVVKLFDMGKHKHVYDAVLTTATENVLKKYPAIIPEGLLFDLNNLYAAEIRSKITEKSDIADKLIRNLELLRLEDVADTFKLIEENNRHYNVFLPCCRGAKRVWDEYCRISTEIKNPFERKTAMKKLKPQLLQYVTRFPKNKYQPGNPNSFLVSESDWRYWYDLDTGFKVEPKEDQTIIF